MLVLIQIMENKRVVESLSGDFRYPVFISLLIVSLVMKHIIWDDMKPSKP